MAAMWDQHIRSMSPAEPTEPLQTVNYSSNHPRVKQEVKLQLITLIEANEED